MSDNLKDIDPIETQEWLESIDSVVKTNGKERASYIISSLTSHANLSPTGSINTPYYNTINAAEDVPYPGDRALEKRISAAVRWNAIILVQRAQKKDEDLGGHLASFQSSADIYEVCFNHFFKAATDKNGGDLVFFQGHISPGIYSRAFLEGRLSEEQLNNFRQEAFTNGLSSYPHPKLMPEFWQFPTVSMGLGPLNAIYQARFLKYLNNRQLKDTADQKVFAFLGDGECDEIETKGGISIAGREKLNNLIFIINCNLQRLDGPVWGNGKIVDELEGIFAGAKWEVIKVLWDSNYDKLFAKDTSGKLLQLLTETTDGDFQNLRSRNGAYIRENFFGRYPETLELVKDLSDKELEELRPGGHDKIKIYNALRKAYQSDKPVCILVQTIKGFGMGAAAEARNVAHQVKKLKHEDLQHIKTTMGEDFPFSDEELDNLPYWTFAPDSAEYKYLHQRRAELNGYLPKRQPNFTTEFKVPALDDFKALLEAQARPISTTLAFVRILTTLLDNKDIGKQIVPILADESRTFGMEGLFRKIGIYNPLGQTYTPQDRETVSYYREDTSGQLLQEGINEYGATSSWLAAATSYSTNNLPMIPFFIYYSIFGFQRVGDLLWLAGDQQARGFMIGGTSGRTTLNGEGLQHQDGHSHILCSTIPNCISYDPSYAYELAVIIQDGIRRMYQDQENIYYYISTLNETTEQPAMPAGVEKGIIKGIYKVKSLDVKKPLAKVELLGSGAIMRHVAEAAQELNELGISVDLFSVTSYNELAREGWDCEHYNNLNPGKEQKVAYVAQVLDDKLPTVSASDYIRALGASVAPFFHKDKQYVVLGCDGFGRSDSRANLRDFFEVDTKHIVLTALRALVKEGSIKLDLYLDYQQKHNIDPSKGFSLYR